MKSNIETLARIASRIRTPLTLTGLVILVLYILYQQILSLGIFSNVSESSTVTLLTSIIDKIFWLAIICVFLGVGSYLLTLFLSRRGKTLHSSVELVDSNIINNSTKSKKTRDSKDKSKSSKGGSYQ
jgi:hypothetical protein